MDGNLTREGMTADLDALQRAGIGGMIFLEVGIGIPRGPVEFMSKPWQALLKHAVHEADRRGLEFALAAGRVGAARADRGSSPNSRCNIWSPPKRKQPGRRISTPGCRNRSRARRFLATTR